MTSILSVELHLEEIAMRAQKGLRSFWYGGATEVDEENVRQGLALLELLERVAQETGEQPPNPEKEPEKNEAYRRVRQAFFVERMPPGAPGYAEWDEAIHREFRPVVGNLMRTGKVSEAKKLVTAILDGWESQDGFTKEQVQGALNTFTTLALLFNEDPA